VLGGGGGGDLGARTSGLMCLWEVLPLPGNCSQQEALSRDLNQMGAEWRVSFKATLYFGKEPVPSLLKA
jgi:hypothetical protein